ncbi:MAG: DNA translocase FtsK [Desulfobacterales bacterium]|nr:DNA translocase FtsK [Desulfobacterales bacterium]
MARKQKKEQSLSLVQEILAIAVFCGALFLFLSLASFSLSAARSVEPVTAAVNWCGPVGHYTADFLLEFLGVNSFWLVLLPGLYAVKFYFSRSLPTRLPQIIAGGLGLIIAGSGLVAFFVTPAVRTVTLLGRVYPAGGHTGNILLAFLHRYFGQPGSLLLLLLAFLLSLMLALRFSPLSLGQGLVRCGGLLVARFRGGTQPRAGRDKSSRHAPAPVESREDGPKAVVHVQEPLVSEYENEEIGDFQVVPVQAGEYHLPGLGLLDKANGNGPKFDRDHYYAVSRQLEEKLKDFGVIGKVGGISPGPVVTTYEFAPAPGVKINKIVGLADDLAMGLKAESVRIIGSIPGKAALGIEIPNPQREIVYIRDILASDSFRNSSSKLALGLGKDVVGKPVFADLAKMPHLLIAGATGSGKSVAINAIICSILFRATPDEVRFLLIDPKRIELSGYEAIPHLLHPVVVEPKMANRALQWAVREMERRYELLDELRVKNIASYNEVAGEKLPLIVIVVDELADLMMVSSRDVEDSIARLAQMARAAGIHLILATQRPSVDVLTGLIKANFPTRISFKVFSKIDSRTILDSTGAEHLLGDGDMLLLPPRKARLQRIHGAYISEKEIERIVSFIKEQGAARYDESVLEIVESNEDGSEAADDEHDPKYDEAVALVTESGQASISMVQRRLRVGYNRAARMIEIMEKEGIVGPGDGSKPREVLVRRDY